MAGVHLLDEHTGTYNIPFLERYFPDRSVLLIKCVQRMQGFMVPKGNPRGIQSFSDLNQAGLRYVNRQKGSGTRILCDYMCRQASLDTSLIYGYEREEFTHTGVAAIVDSGSADAGLGILSAARMFGLDFVPVSLEQYDILINGAAYELPEVQAFIKTIQSEEFRKRLEDLGGYSFSSPGEIVWR
jgi:putative molybdopterin biosynthesis protein